MKKVLFAILMCISIFGLVGCSGSTALDITKKNYKEYGYNYADVELQKMVKDRKEGNNKYEYSDLADATAFLASVEFGVDLEETTKDQLKNGN